jgi:serine/threonine-protein kinase
VLARAEAALARFVGPLAAVLVRRAAQACRDEPELYARLAEQITQASARDAFLGRSSRSGTGSGSGFGALSTGAGLASQGGTTSHELPLEHAPSSFGALGQERVPVSDALLEQAERLLAAHVGPIARVLVRRAVARTRQREALFALLAESVPESARARLQAELSRLR